MSTDVTLMRLGTPRKVVNVLSPEIDTATPEETSIMTPPGLDQQRDNLIQIMKGYRRVAVAFSGGVDSALVAKAAVIACGEQAVAVTASSPSLAQGELELAASVAAQIGIRHQVINTNEFDVSGYQKNAGNRCYFCKSELYRVLESVQKELQFDVICNGTNCDDLGDHRPGLIAASEHQIRSPLVEAGFNKQAVRDLAKLWDLPVWNKPASPCLSSRIAYGVSVTQERVHKVDQAETYLKDLLDCNELRVRLEHNELARIEVPIHELGKLVDHLQRPGIVTAFQKMGFNYVTVDLQGLQSGSMNRVLSKSSLPILDLE